MSASLTALAPAKLNLTLSVGSATASGDGRVMHPICSWMVTVNLFDELHLTRLESGRLSRYAILWHADAKRRQEINWSITKDLAVRAHLALEQHIGRALPVQMKLQKRIPVGGGLGGGSSDAAAMLRALNDLFDLQISIDDLASIGSTLGSDVPFLVRGGSAIVEGFGERITHTAMPPLHAVVAFPEAMCPTGAVYAAFDEILSRNGASPHAGSRDAMAHLLDQFAAGNTPAELLFNDLSEPARSVAPQLHTDLQSMAELANRQAHVTGSGSSLFVVCDDQMHAIALADTVERRLKLPAVAVQTCAVNHHATVA